MRKLALFTVVILLTCFNTQAQYNSAPGFYEIKMNEPLQPLQNYLLVAEDKTHRYSWPDVISNNKLFKPIEDFKSLDQQSTWWCKIIIHSAFDLNNFLIALKRVNTTGFSAGNEIMNAYIINNGAIEHEYKAGMLEPASAREIKRPFNLNAFPFNIKSGETKTVVLQLRSIKNSSALNFNFAIQQKEFAANTSVSYVPLITAYAGIMFILFLFGLVFSFITKEKSFYWFTLVALFYLLHSFLLHPGNLFAQWFLPNHPVSMLYAWLVLTYINQIFYWQFGRTFVEAKKISKRLNFLTKALMLAIFVSFLFNTASLTWFPFSGDKMIYSVEALIFIASLFISIRFLFEKNILAKQFGLAACWLFIFQLCGVLWEMQVLPHDIPNPWITAQIGTILIIFFALAHRFKQSAKEKAEAQQVVEMDKIKNRFFANISHEFRTPLTLMLGPLKQLEENNADTSTQKKYFGMMRRNGERLLQLINQLLDLSKLESGKIELHVSKTDMTGLLKMIAASFESYAEQKQVNYHVHFPEENMIGFIDRDKTEKILVNLLSNAFNFTSKNGTVSLHISADDNRLRFSVQDNGSGIPKEQLDKIFDRFHQAEGTEGGTGIGLSLVKELVQVHKGQISVSSELGKGSTFRVSIPIAKENYSNNELSENVQPIETTLTSFVLNDDNAIDEEIISDNSLPTILIVEDNADLQQFIKETLSKDFQTQVATNGKMGLQKAKEIVPDLIISDVMMPEMNGIEMTQQIKSEAATSHVPIIMLTAKAGSASKIEGLQTGTDDYLIKPFDANELIVRCRNLIEQRKKLRALFSKQIISITPSEIEAGNTQQQFLQKIRTVIEENLDNEMFSVVDLANSVFMSRSQLHRKLKALTGEAPNELIRNFRLERAMQLLKENSGTITEIAYMTGFSSPAYFSKCFNDKYGYSPNETKKYQA